MISKEGYKYIRELYAKGYKHPAMLTSMLLLKEYATSKYMEVRKLVIKELNRIEQEIKIKENDTNK